MGDASSLGDSSFVRKCLCDLIIALCIRKGDFTLASGAVSDTYVDCKKLLTVPMGLTYAAHAVAHELREVDSYSCCVRGVAGYGMGGVPLAAAVVSALCCSTHLKLYHAADCSLGVSPDLFMPSLILVRDAPKDHGTKRCVEAPLSFEHGGPVALVEDVTTTGGSALKAARLLRQEHLICHTVVTLVDREEGALDNLLAEDINLVSVFTLSDLCCEERFRRVRTF